MPLKVDLKKKVAKQICDTDLTKFRVKKCDGQKRSSHKVDER